MKPEDLITYCGGFCATCVRSANYTAFRDAASLLAELAYAHGFQHWMPDAAEEHSYAEFRKGLDFFADPNSWLVCKKGCRGGDGGLLFAFGSAVSSTMLISVSTVVAFLVTR